MGASITDVVDETVTVAPHPLKLAHTVNNKGPNAAHLNKADANHGKEVSSQHCRTGHGTLNRLQLLPGIKARGIPRHYREKQVQGTR